MKNYTEQERISTLPLFDRIAAPQPGDLIRRGRMVCEVKDVLEHVVECEFRDPDGVSRTDIPKGEWDHLAVKTVERGAEFTPAPTLPLFEAGKSPSVKTILTMMRDGTVENTTVEYGSPEPDYKYRGWRPIKPGSQCAKVFDYLKTHGSITDAEARDRLGITRVGARIWDLHHEHGIATEQTMIEVPNRRGDTCRVARYTLSSNDQGQP